MAWNLNRRRTITICRASNSRGTRRSSADLSSHRGGLDQNLQSKKRRTNRPEEISVTKSDPEEISLTESDYNELRVVPYNEAKQRCSVVSVFHNLVSRMSKEHETPKEDDNPNTMKVSEKAAALLKAYCENLPSNHLGSVPGVEVGNVFQSRILLYMIGLHHHPRAGIYYVKSEIAGKMEPLAASIVLSGRYEDDVDNGDTILYAGQGGNDPETGRQKSHQRPSPENEALKNSCKNKQPVRLIRSCYKKPSQYRYDGLYNIEKCWFATGRSGYMVFMSKLRRQENQHPLGFQRVHLKGSSQRKEARAIKRLIAIKQDIAERRENFDIPVINYVDDVYTLDDFKYVLTLQYRGFLPKPELLEGCSCPEGCTDAKNCLCARRNGGQFPYTDNGRLVRPKVVVFECGKNCECPSTCKNRVAQRGLRHKLEIFRTQNKEWGVWGMEFIVAGEFIGEYAGDVILDCSPNNSQNKFIFPIFSLSMQGNIGDNDVVSASSFRLGKEKRYKVDASSSGNVCRFMRRKSRPNVFAQYVLYDHHDTDIPHVMLFAYDNIPPEFELSIGSTAEKTIHNDLLERKDTWSA